MKLDIIASNRFKKDLKLIRKHGMNLKNLEFVIDTLANKKKLDIKYRDHALAGKYKNFRECHIEPDWLLREYERPIYRKAFILSNFHTL